MPEGMSPLVLTMKETAAVLNLSESSVARLIRSGELDSVKIGKSRRVRPAAIASFLDRREAAQRPSAVDAA